MTIEAVNASIVSASVLQSSAGRATAQPSLNDISIDQLPEPHAAPQAPYVSLNISINYDYDKAVLQIRDSDTGEVENQFPTESRLAEQQQAQAALQQQSRARAEQSLVNQAEARAPSAAPNRVEQPQQQARDVVTVQEITALAPSNAPSSTPQAASAALTAATQTSSAPTSTVSVNA